MDGFEIVKVNEIIRCKADNNYTEIYLLNGKTHIISKTLKFYEDLLKEMDFVRVHKTHLVNIQYVKKYTKGKGGFATMQDGAEVEVSSSKKENFMRFFK
jgi:two-component system LytT family response regulator